MVWYRRIEQKPYFVFTRDCLIFATGSTMQSEIHGSARAHYLRSSKYTTARRDFTSESANVSYQCDDAYANNPIQRFQHLAVPTTFQKRLENENELSRKSKRKFSDNNEDEIEPPSASRLAGCQRLPANKCCSTRTSIPKRPRLSGSSSQITDDSSVVQDVSTCAGLMRNFAECTYQSAFPQRRDQEQVACDVLVQPLQEEISVRQDDPKHQHESDDACGNGGYPFESRCSIAGCLLPTGTDAAAEKTKKTRTSSATIIFDSNCRVDTDVLFKTGVETFESSNGTVLEASDAPITQFGDDNVFLSNPEYGSGPSVFQFPYKKRPHNWSSFLSVAAPRCFDDQPLPIEYSHPGYFVDLTDRNELPCFKPLYYLQQLLTPQQVEQVTAQNPGTEWARY